MYIKLIFKISHPGIQYRIGKRQWAEGNSKQRDLNAANYT